MKLSSKSVLNWLLILGLRWAYSQGILCNFRWQSPDHQYANKDDNFTINCDFTADHESSASDIVTVTWINPRNETLQLLLYNGNVQGENTVDNWKRASTFIRPATVQLSAASAGDAGNYTCRIAISAGCGDSVVVNIRNVVFTVRVPPSKPVITRHQSTGFTVREGDSPKLKCMSATGTPPLTYTWSRGSTSLTGTPDSANTFSILTIPSIQRSQQGPYQCSVQNEAGPNTADSVTLDVQYPPGPATATPDTITTTGQSVTFQCSVNSVGNPSTTTWQWSTDTSITLPSSSTSQLTLSGLTVSHDGKYYCTPSNSVGAGTRAEITLIVNKPPVISPALPDELSASVLSQFSIDCRVEAKPRATVEWKFNNGVLPAIFTTTALESNSGKLFVTNVTLTWSSSSTSDQRKAGAGVLTCSATNTAVTSPVLDTVNLDVQYPPGRATVDGGQSSTTVTAMEGQPHTLNCEFTDKGNPQAASFDWYIHGSTNSSRHGASYQISPTTLSDSGTYQCRPYNTIGRGDAATITLSVNASSTIQSNPQNLTVNESDVSVQLTCGARGKPVPTVTWTHGDQHVNSQLYTVQNTPQLNGVTQYDTVTSTLTLTGPGRTGDKVTRTDLGYYSCTASNGVGTATMSSAYINVQYRAELHPSKVTVREVATDLGSEGLFTLYVVGNPKPTSYTWTRVNGILPANAVSGHDIENQKSTLRIPNLRDEDYGNYTCVVKNAAGERGFTFILERRGKPDPPTDLSNQTISAISVTVEWTSNKNGGYKQTFTVQYKSPGEDWESITNIDDPGYKQKRGYKVENLQADTQYTFRVESRNKDGSGGYSDELPVQTKAKPVITESSLTVDVKGNVATVKWSIPKGEFTSYGIRYCVQGTTQCDIHNITNVTTTSADITLPNGGGHYELHLIVYQGDDAVVTSPFIRIKRPEPNFPAAAVAVPVVVVLLAAIGAVAFVYIRRRRQEDKKGPDMELSGDREYRRVDDNGSGSDIVTPDSPYAVTYSATENQGGGAAGVEGLYAQPDKKKKQEKREQDPGALYAKPEKKKKKKGNEKDEELTTLYAQPDKGKKKKKKAEAKPAYDEDENPYQNVENKNDPGENPYANVESGGQVVEEKVEDPKDSAKNIGPDGTVYADLTFTKKPKGKNQKDEIIRTEEATEYATIDFKRKAPPT